MKHVTIMWKIIIILNGIVIHRLLKRMEGKYLKIISSIKKPHKNEYLFNAYIPAIILNNVKS